MSNSLLGKENFPVFNKYNNLVYLDNSATQQKPKRVIDTLAEYYIEQNANPLRGLYELSVKATEDYENARKSVKEFIGANRHKRDNLYTKCHRKSEPDRIQLGIGKY